MDPNPEPQPPRGAITGDELEKLVLKALLVFFMAVIVYIPAMSGGYIYDDDTLLTQNPVITRGSGFLDGESWKGLGTIWFPRGDGRVVDYAPLASTTLWVEWRLWGVNHPAGYHTVNILLHSTGALLLWAVLAETGVPVPWAAALIWAVHPVGAESVAWIAERRNTLSMPVLLLTLLAWFRFQRTHRWRDYALALFLFALALLAKSTVVMLPLFLPVWAWWKRGRVTVRDAIETAPFFILSLMAGIVTMWFQYERAIAGETLPAGGLFHRIVSAGFALGFYFYKAALPFNLMFNYPEWHNHVRLVFQLLSWFPIAAVFYWIWLNRLTWGRHAILGAGFFVIMIAPALGIMKMAYMRITLLADHFEYMPMAGLIALGVAWVAWLPDRFRVPFGKHAAGAAAAGVIILFSVLTWRRADVFHDAESLWVDTLRKNPDAWQAHEHLGGILLDRHDYNGALEHFRRGVELRPWLGEVHNNYGNTLRDVGRMDEGLQENALALKLSGKNVPVAILYSYAGALLSTNHFEEAAAQYAGLLKQSPGNPMVCYSLGLSLMQAGKTDEAIDAFREALRLAPDFQAAQERLAEALQRRETDRKK